MLCAKLKVNVTIYFVTNELGFILNIGSTEPYYKNKLKDKVLQEIKKFGAPQSYYISASFIH